MATNGKKPPPYDADADLKAAAQEGKEMSLIGRYFHSLDEVTGKIHWQGLVVGHPEPGVYLVQLFEWMMGEPNVMRLVRIEDMLGWLFYGDREAMLFSHEHGVAREGGPYRDRIDP